MTLGEAYDKFVQAARDGVALNKWRRRYRPRAVEDLASARPTSPTAWRGVNPTTSSAVTYQALVDKLSAKGLSVRGSVR